MTNNPTDGSRTPADEELARLRRQAFLASSDPERLRQDADVEEAVADQPAGEGAIGTPSDDARAVPDGPPPPPDHDHAAGDTSATERPPAPDAPDAASGPEAPAELGTDDWAAAFAAADPDDPADPTSGPSEEAITAAAGTAAPHRAGDGDDDARRAAAAAEQDAAETGDPAPAAHDEARAEDTAPVADDATNRVGDDAGATVVVDQDPDAHPEDSAEEPAEAPAADDEETYTPLFAAARAAAERGESGASPADAGGAREGEAVTGTPAEAPSDDATRTLAAGAPVATAAAALRPGDDPELPDTWHSLAPQDAPPRRGLGTHLWVLLVSLLLLPVAWYLVADAGARLTAGESTSWVTGDMVVEHVVELAAGVVLVVLALLLVRISSIGAWVWGVAATVLGIAWVAVPGPTSGLLTPVLDGLRDLSGVQALGENIADHLVTDGTSGRLLLYGAALVAIAITTQGARRSGRAEGTFEAEERLATRERR